MSVIRRACCQSTRWRSSRALDFQDFIGEHLFVIAIHVDDYPFGAFMQKAHIFLGNSHLQGMILQKDAKRVFLPFLVNKRIEKELAIANPLSTKPFDYRHPRPRSE